ncbi:MAG: NAD(P)H-dependent glycerol-3-phosphate dehydrogenase [Gemmatimonadota bacterium]
MTDARKIGILGAGSWGTAMGQVLARNGHGVTLWSHDPEVAGGIRTGARNEKYLPGIDLAPTLHATPDLEASLAGAEVVICATPSHAVREVFGEARAHLPGPALLVSGTKGIEDGTGLRMSQVIHEVLGDGASAGDGLVVFSGPSFAEEVAKGLPTAVAAASADPDAARRCQELFQNEHLRVYTQPDVVGTELGGALKNVIALAAGISDGLGLGNNARAALLTRGLAEMARLVVEMGGREATLSGLAGVGDLVLTCTGDLSRNRRTGLAIGRGAGLEEAMEEVEEVVEGVRTTRAARELARRHGVEMPIVDAVYSILHEGVGPRAALAELMAREPKPERW